MTLPDPLARLSELDATLERGLKALPTFVQPWRGAVVLHCGQACWAIPGAVVRCRHDPHEHPVEAVILNTLRHGLETFDSAQSLYQELAERLEDACQGAALLAPHWCNLRWKTFRH